MTGITEAAKSRTPLVVLAAEATAPRSNFYIDQAGLAAAVGAVPRASARARRLPRRRRPRAYWTARDERRTVVLNLPLDVQAAEVAELARAPPRIRRRPTCPSTRRASTAGRRAAPRPSGRCSSPAGARGAGAGRRWRAGRAVRGAARDVGGRQGPVRRRPVVARRVAAGSPRRWRAELIARRRPRRRLGLRAEHVDHAARRADRPGGATVVQVDVDPDALGAHRPVDLGVRRRRPGDSAAAAASLPARTDGGYRSRRRRRPHRRRGRWRDVAIDDTRRRADRPARR